jgi:hypothetical protein
LEVREGALPSNHWLVPYTRAFVGECLFAQGKFESAERLILPSAQQLEELRGPTDKYARLTLKRVHRMYQVWGKPEQAANYETKNVEKVEPPKTRD